MILIIGCEKPDFPNPNIVACNCGVIIEMEYPPINDYTLIVKNDCTNAIDSVVVDSAWFSVKERQERVCDYK